MALPFRFRIQEGKVKQLEKEYEGWKRDYDEAMAAFDYEDLVVEVIDLAKQTLGLCNRVRADLPNMDTDMILALGEFMDLLLPRTSTLLDRVADDTMKFAADTGHTIRRVEEVRKVSEELREVHRRLLKNWPRRDVQWPEVNQEMRRRSRERVSGPGEDTESILKRLREGGQLLPENK